MHCNSKFSIGFTFKLFIALSLISLCVTIPSEPSNWLFANLDRLPGFSSGDFLGIYGALVFYFYL